MKIGIVGYGFVGQAIANSHLYFTTDELYITDPEKLADKSASIDDIKQCDLIYVAVPSPSNTDGSCNSEILEDVLAKLNGSASPIVCKTTAPPSVYEKLQKDNSNVIYSPEFLTARNSKQDYLETRFFIFGGDKTVSQKAAKIMFTGRSYEYYDIVYTDIKTAALYKYLMNCYLATKVTFMNEFKILSEKMGVAWEDLQQVMAYDSRIGNTHTMVPGPDGKRGWGGMCFPKDMSAIIKEANNIGTSLHLLNRVTAINHLHRGLPPDENTSNE